MSTDAPRKASLSLSLDGEESAELLQLLEVALQDLRVEVHRTHSSPEYREQLMKREALLKRLIERFHQGSS
jgi:hypothetical protein